MGELSIVEQMRLHSVSRWNLVSISREQSVVEHSFNVAMLCREYCKRKKINDEFFLRAAMVHDMSEAVYGDMPTPTKHTLKVQGIDINALTKIGPDEKDMLGPRELVVFKAMDMVEAIVYLDNYGIGRRARQVVEDLKDQLECHLFANETRESSLVEDLIICREIYAELMNNE